MQGQEYRKYVMEDYKHVINLKQKGLSQREIAETVGVSSATVWHWCNTNRKPRAIYAKKLQKMLQKSAKKLSIHLAYIYGVLVGDGSIEKNNSISRIVLNVIDKEFADKFENELIKWSKMTPTRTERDVTYNHKTKYGNTIKGKSHFYIIRLSSKQAVEFLLSRIKCKTYDWEVPNEIINSNDEKIICSFLNGVYDSDGYVINSGRNRFIGLEMWGKKGLKGIQVLLNKISIENRIVKLGKSPMTEMYLVIISKRKDIELFSKKINFTITRKRRVLLNLLKTYKRYIFSKEEIEQLILDCLRNHKNTTADIAKTIKTSRSVIYYHLKKLNKDGKINLVRNWRKVNGNAPNVWYIS